MNHTTCTLIKCVVSLFLSITLSNHNTAHAQQEWYEVGSTDESIWEVQSGSFEETRTKGGDPIVVMISRVTNKSTKRIDLRKTYVPVASCEKRMGKVVTLDLDGKFRYENDFLIGGGTIASGLAEFVCEVHSIRVKAAEKKGI
jgi:hypothetical protein